MTRFNSVFSLSNIAATFTDSHSYPASKWVVNGVTPSNYMMCYLTIDECIEIAGVEQDSNFVADYTPKEIQEMCREAFSQVFGDNVESYRDRAEKAIWNYFLATGKITTASIRDVNYELIITLSYYGETAATIPNKGKIQYYS